MSADSADSEMLIMTCAGYVMSGSGWVAVSMEGAGGRDRKRTGREPVFAWFHAACVDTELGESV